MSKAESIVYFQGGGMSRPLLVRSVAQTPLIDVVREQARDGHLPLYWRCGQGTCGACVVFLDFPAADTPPALPMLNKERNVLLRLKRPDTASLVTSTPSQHSPEQPRLACHILLPPGLCHVRW